MWASTYITTLRKLYLLSDYQAYWSLLLKKTKGPNKLKKYDINKYKIGTFMFQYHQESLLFSSVDTISQTGGIMSVFGASAQNNLLANE